MGKGQKVFSEISVDSCMQYETLKRALLLAYARVPDFHRKRFRNLTKGSAESHSNLIRISAFDSIQILDGGRQSFRRRRENAGGCELGTIYTARLYPLTCTDG